MTSTFVNFDLGLLSPFLITGIVYFVCAALRGK